jgi:hypothetical protein
VGRLRNQRPGIVRREGIEFLLHRLAPVGVTESLPNRGGEGRHRCGGDMGVTRVRLDDVVPSSSEYVMTRRRRGRHRRSGG